MARKMKDSGIEWIGEIPEGWRTCLYKYCCSVQPGYPFNSAKFSNSSTDGFPLIRIRDITSGEIQTYYTGEYPPNYIVTAGDLLVGMDGDFNVRWWNNDAALLNQRCCRVTEKDSVLRRFLYYVLPFTLQHINTLTYATTVKHLANGDILNSFIAFPSLPAQQNIVHYLDTVCSEIDAMLSKTRSSIEEHKKLKQAVITQAVTKGVRGEREMKDSGVEWAGLVPHHWGVAKIGSIGQTSSGATPLRSKEASFFDDATIRWVRTLDLNDGLVYDSSEKITELALASSACSIMPKGTVCVAMYGGAGTIGKCGLLMSDCATNQAVCSIVCNREIVSPIFLLMQLLALKSYWMKYAVGTRKDPNISQDIVARMKILIPPLDEQKEITDHLDAKCAEINKLIAKKEQLVKELESYKKSLIYEVVTGKREV